MSGVATHFACPYRDNARTWLQPRARTGIFSRGLQAAFGVRTLGGHFELSRHSRWLTMSSTALVTAWIGQVKAGDRAAAQRLWERYCTRLVRLARAKLPASRRRVDDEEDVALSAMDSFLRAAERPPSKPARPRQLVSAAGHHYGAQGLESRTAREAHSRSRRIGPGRAQRRLLRPARLGTGSRPRAHAGNRVSSGRALPNTARSPEPRIAVGCPLENGGLDQ